MEQAAQNTVSLLFSDAFVIAFLIFLIVFVWYRILFSKGGWPVCYSVYRAGQTPLPSAAESIGYLEDGLRPALKADDLVRAREFFEACGLADEFSVNDYGGIFRAGKRVGEVFKADGTLRLRFYESTVRRFVGEILLLTWSEGQCEREMRTRKLEISGPETPVPRANKLG